MHGDFSEYNLLWDGTGLVVIDVSQSVEEDHPLSIFFLKRDLVNLNRYFRQLGVAVFKLVSLYKYITKSRLDQSKSLTKLMEEAILVDDKVGDDDEDKTEETGSET